MEKEGKVFRNYVEKKKLIKTKLAADLGMSQQNLYQLFSSKELTAETKGNIEKTLKVKWKDIADTNIDTNVSHETNTNIVNEPDFDYGSLSMRAIVNLTESNKSIAESNASLARSNEELVKMVKQSTADAPSQNDLIVETIRSEALGLLFEIGAGKRWHSTDEVKAAWNKRISEAMGLGKEAGTQTSSGRPHKVK